jgi:hypothetical protein
MSSLARLHGTSAHRVEVEVGADRPASAPLSGAAAAAPPAGADATCIHNPVWHEFFKCWKTPYEVTDAVFLWIPALHGTFAKLNGYGSITFRQLLERSNG